MNLRGGAIVIDRGLRMPTASERAHLALVLITQTRSLRWTRTIRPAAGLMLQKGLT